MTTLVAEIGHITCDVCEYLGKFFNAVGKGIAVAGQHRANHELKRLGYLNKDGSFNEKNHFGLGTWEA
tara:strand:- start:54 stop:257 length:204 start_codon:yes stop_codon:yes gene_type:complete